MEDFIQLFGGLLSFVYHCFDRIVILGHLPLLTRPENVAPKIFVAAVGMKIARMAYQRVAPMPKATSRSLV